MYQLSSKLMMLMNHSGCLWRRETRWSQTPVLSMMFPFLGGGSECLLTTRPGSSGQTWDLNARTGGWHFHFFVIIEMFKVLKLVKSINAKMSYCVKTSKDDWTIMHNHSFWFIVISVCVFFLPRTNKALSLDGSKYGTIGNMTGLRIEKR